MIHRAQPVNLVTQQQAALRGNLVYPGMQYLARIDVQGQQVGHIDYSINPLRDRVYISMIEVSAEHRRRGYALGSLWRLWQEHQVPIVPLYQYGTSDGFWQIARARFAAAGVSIGDELRGAQMDAEIQRWAHLVPKSKHERRIRSLKAPAEWSAVRAEMEAKYGPCRDN